MDNNNNNNMPMPEVPRTTRGRKPSAKTPKAPRRRGLGVAQLERIRMEESWREMSEALAPGVLPNAEKPHILDSSSFHDKPPFLPQCHFHNFNNNNNNNNTVFPSGSGGDGGGNNPVLLGTPTPQPQQPPYDPRQHVMNARFVLSTGSAAGGGGGVNFPGGWSGPNQVYRQVAVQPPVAIGSGAPFWSGGAPLVGTPITETSKELHSMPNLSSQPHLLEFKKPRFNEESVRGSNARRYMPLDQNFPGFNLPQFASSNFFNSQARIDAAVASVIPKGNVAFHKRGNTSGERKVMTEYEFLPAAARDDSGSTSEELSLAIALGSVAAEASSSITARTYNGDSACNSVDLSLKL